MIQLYSDDYTLSYWANRASAAMKELVRISTMSNEEVAEARIRARTLGGCASGVMPKNTVECPYCGSPRMEGTGLYVCGEGLRGNVQGGCRVYYTGRLIRELRAELRKYTGSPSVPTARRPGN